MTTFAEPKTIVETFKASMEQFNSFYDFMKQTQIALVDKAINRNNQMVKEAMDWNREFFSIGEDIYKKSLDSYMKSLEKIAASWEN